jgi:hypothetical protein
MGRGSMPIVCRELLGLVADVLMDRNLFYSTGAA